MLKGPGRKAIAAVVFASLVQIAACGESEDGGSSPDGGLSSGIDKSKALRSLTDAERKTVCDWAAGLFGGYDKSRQCTAQTSWPGPNSPESCPRRVLPSATSSCSATVGTFEQCWAAFFKPDACKEPATLPSACQTLFSCSGR